MSENAYGFHHNLGLGNMNDHVGEALNQKIRQLNNSNITKHQNNIKNAVDTFNNNEGLNSSFKKISEVVGDQLLTKGQAVENTLKAAQKTYGALRDAKSMTFGKVAAQGDESFASEAVRNARRAAFIGEDGGAVAKTALGGAKVLGGALQVGFAIDDFATDVKAGKISGSNVISKVGDITAQVSGGVEATGLLGAAGGLEAAGLSADATLFGAPVGVALNVAGGVLGLVAAGEDLIGDKEEKDKLADAKTAAQNTTVVPQQAQQPIASKALGTTGAEVKNNIQGGS
tara:strand:- start:993 stop:1850 length:858 start_codon:yes stop_codon:yes gene_type:complete